MNVSDSSTLCFMCKGKVLVVALFYFFRAEIDLKILLPLSLSRSLRLSCLCATSYFRGKGNRTLLHAMWEKKLTTNPNTLYVIIIMQKNDLTCCRITERGRCDFSDQRGFCSTFTAVIFWNFTPFNFFPFNLNSSVEKVSIPVLSPPGHEL